MRKFASYGAAVVLTLSAMGAGAIYAQDTTTDTTTDTAIAAVASARTWLGVAVSDTENGVTITRVSTGSPAAAAALQVDDVIVAVNGTAIATAADLRAAIEAAAAGDVVELTIERADEEISVEVTLEAQAARGPRGDMFADPLQMVERSLGVTLEVVDAGYQVVSVDEDATLALEAGDIITAVNGEAVADLDWRSLFDPAAADENAVTLTVQRGDEELDVEGALAFFGGRQQGMRPGGGQPNGDQNQRPPNGGMPDGNIQPPNGNNAQPGDAPLGDLVLPPVSGDSL